MSREATVVSALHAIKGFELVGTIRIVAAKRGAPKKAGEWNTEEITAIVEFDRRHRLGGPCKLRSHDVGDAIADGARRLLQRTRRLVDERELVERAEEHDGEDREQDDADRAEDEQACADSARGATLQTGRERWHTALRLPA